MDFTIVAASIGTENQARGIGTSRASRYKDSIARGGYIPESDTRC